MRIGRDWEHTVRAPQPSDGISFGGDDVVKAIIERHVIPAIEQHWIRLERAVSSSLDTGAVPRLESHRLADFAGRFTSDLAALFAMALRNEHKASLSPDDVPCERTIACCCFDRRGRHSRRRCARRVGRDEGTEGFSPPIRR